jgi:hypothetical protein
MVYEFDYAAVVNVLPDPELRLVLTLGAYIFEYSADGPSNSIEEIKKIRNNYERLLGRYLLGKEGLVPIDQQDYYRIGPLPEINAILPITHNLFFVARGRESDHPEPFVQLLDGQNLNGKPVFGNAYFSPAAKECFKLLREDLKLGFDAY